MPHFSVSHKSPLRRTPAGQIRFDGLLLSSSLSVMHAQATVNDNFTLSLLVAASQVSFDGVRIKRPR